MSGESEIEYISSNDEIVVLWNWEEYPVPPSVSLSSANRAIDDALEVMGFHGPSQFWVYGEAPNRDADEWEDCQLLSGCQTPGADIRIPMDLILRASLMLRARGESTVLLVIAKQSSELLRVQQCLKSRKHTLLVLVDDAAPESLLVSADSVLEGTQLLGGGKPRSAYGFYYPPDVVFEYCDDDFADRTEESKNASGVIDDIHKMEDFEEDLADRTEESKNASDVIEAFDIHKIEDFSEPLTLVQGDKIAVFWHVEDCPFPLGSNPDEIHRRIVSALRLKGFNGEIYVFAYIDENNNKSWSGECLRNKSWDSRIYFLPGGDIASRLQRMQNDILLLEMDNSPRGHPCPADVTADVIVVSHQVGPTFFETLDYLSVRSGNVFLVTPTQDANRPESPEWLALLLQDVHVHDFVSERRRRFPISISSSSSEPNPKKHKAERRTCFRATFCS